jgi:subtilisin-like proprotein convertase family protein
MKIPPLPTLAAAGCLLSASSLSAAVLSFTASPGSNIPDGSTSGLISPISIASSPTPQYVSHVTIELTLSAPAGELAFLGDLLIALNHGSYQSVLMNRPGLSLQNPAGYSDGPSVSISFNDTAANGDIHTYRTTLTGSELAPFTGSLSGAWQPDGRAVDPDVALSTVPRTANLAGFNGANAEGDWTLFLADVSGGGQYRLDNWTITIETTAVPEPAAWAAIAGLGLSCFAVVRARLQNRA